MATSDEIDGNGTNGRTGKRKEEEAGKIRHTYIALCASTRNYKR